jgi:hypothetical protein
MRALLKGKTPVEQAAFDVSRGLQHHPERADRTNEAPTDRHVLRNDVTLELCILAEHKRDTLNVALNSAIEMKLALRCHVSGDR